MKIDMKIVLNINIQTVMNIRMKMKIRITIRIKNMIQPTNSQPLQLQMKCAF